MQRRAFLFAGIFLHAFHSQVDVFSSLSVMGSFS